MKKCTITFVVIGGLLVLGGCKKMEKDFLKNETNPSATDVQPSAKDAYIPGEIIVGFKKEVTREKAEEVLKKYNLTFEQRVPLNTGKGFFNATDERFVVKVPVGEEVCWQKTLEQEQDVYKAVDSVDANKMILD